MEYEITGTTEAIESIHAYLDGLIDTSADGDAVQVPLDVNARLALADAIQEQGGERLAQGLRALAINNLAPLCYVQEQPPYCRWIAPYQTEFWYAAHGFTANMRRHCTLPVLWFSGLTHWAKRYEASFHGLRTYGTRREAEEAAMIAFTLLPEKFQQQYLAGKL